MKNTKRKLPRKFAPALFVLIMVTIMSAVISFAMTAINAGFSAAFALVWLRAWGLSFMVATPAAFVAVPVARRIVAALTEAE